MKILLLVVAALWCAAPSESAPQLFPFSSLRSYFEHTIRDGPGAETGGDTAREPAVVDASAEASAPTTVTPDSETDSSDEDAFSAEAAPVVGLLRPVRIPAQVLEPPAASAPAADFAAILEAVSSPSPATELRPPLESADQSPAVVFLPPVPSLSLATPPLTPEDQDVLAPTPTPKNHRPAAPKADEPSEIKKKSPYPKKVSAKFAKEQEQYKQRQKQQQNVAATVEAAAFHKEIAAPARLKDASEEQVAAESGFASISTGAGHHHGLGLGGGGGDDRVEFQMHGQHGPHSYKWGYDTGKGHNRQFRYEERDVHGHVKGTYGFYDKHGKLQVVSYSADPETGYHADGNFGKHGIA